MESKVCVICKTEKSSDNFPNIQRDCKPCNFERNLRRYYENKDNLSNQRKINYDKNRDALLAKSKGSRKNRKSRSQQMKAPNNKVKELTRTMEMLILKK